MVISVRLAPDPKRLPRYARALKDGEDILKKYSWGAMTGRLEMRLDPAG